MSDGSSQLRIDAPAVADVVERLAVARPVDAHLTSLIRSTCAAVHDLPPVGPITDGAGFGGTGGTSGTGGPDGPDDERDDVVAELARRFATDVTTIDDDLRARLGGSCGEDVFAVVQAVWISDQLPRLRAALDALFGASPDWPSAPDDEGGTDAWALIDDFIRVVHQLDSLDAVTAEVVRLRGARQHRCRLCQSLRSRPALVAGGDDQLWAAVDRPESLASPAHRAAIGLVDAMIWTPGRIDPAVVDAVRSELTPEQATEVVLDVVRNAANKIAVALAADEAHVSEGVEVYEIDHDGTAHYGLEPPLV